MSLDTRRCILRGSSGRLNYASESAKEYIFRMLPLLFRDGIQVSREMRSVLLRKGKFLSVFMVLLHKLRLFFLSFLSPWTPRVFRGCCRPFSSHETLGNNPMRELNSFETTLSLSPTSFFMAEYLSTKYSLP